MMKLIPPTLEQLVWRVQEQALEMATLRAAIHEQIENIAHMQTQLDVMAHARKRRKLHTLRTQPLSQHGDPRSRA